MSYSPRVPTEVNDVSSLTLLSSSDGPEVAVKSLLSPWLYVTDSPQFVVDHITVEETADGGSSRWVRDDQFSHPAWRASVAHVYIDPVNGNDENQGIYFSSVPPSAPASLRTAQELRRRWGANQIITSETTSEETIIHILGPIVLGQDRLDINLIAGLNTNLRFLGEATTILHSGALDASDGFILWNPSGPAGGTPNVIKDTTSGVSWADYIGKRLHFPRVDAWAYIVKDLGDGSARISVPQFADEPNFGVPINTFPASGDTYAIEDPVHVSLGQLVVSSAADQSGNFGAFVSINFADMSFDTSTDGGSIGVGTLDVWTSVTYYQCAIYGTVLWANNQGVTSFCNCRAFNLTVSSSADGAAVTTYWFGGAFVGEPGPRFFPPYININGGALHTAPIDYDATIQGGCVVALGNVELRAFSVWDAVPFLDNPEGHAILIGTSFNHSAAAHANLSVRVPSIIFGSGSQGVGVCVAPRCSCVVNAPPEDPLSLIHI